MRLYNLLLLVLILNACEETLTSAKVLENAIAYHDPQNKWASFKGELSITMEIPNKPSRLSNINIDLPNEYFQLKSKRDTIATEMTVNKGDCSFKLNDTGNISEEDLKKNNLTCERANLFKNYYTYLYGLPMKLKDTGTKIDPKVETRHFKGKTYLVLKVTYEQSVGSDIWYFYFNPQTYAMEVYQFFKTDENGVQKNDSGEYILLTEEKEVSGIKMPKNRAWYYNKNDELLGTDILN